jgi:hypothetical protein
MKHIRKRTVKSKSRKTKGKKSKGKKSIKNRKSKLNGKGGNKVITTYTFKKVEPIQYENETPYDIVRPREASSSNYDTVIPREASSSEYDIVQPTQPIFYIFTIGIAACGSEAIAYKWFQSILPNVLQILGNKFSSIVVGNFDPYFDTKFDFSKGTICSPEELQNRQQKIQNIKNIINNDNVTSKYYSSFSQEDLELINTQQIWHIIIDFSNILEYNRNREGEVRIKSNNNNNQFIKANAVYLGQLTDKEYNPNVFGPLQLATSKFFIIENDNHVLTYIDMFISHGWLGDPTDPWDFFEDMYNRIMIMVITLLKSGKTNGYSPTRDDSKIRTLLNTRLKISEFLTPEYLNDENGRDTYIEKMANKIAGEV